MLRTTAGSRLTAQQQAALQPDLMHVARSQNLASALLMQISLTATREEQRAQLQRQPSQGLPWIRAPVGTVHKHAVPSSTLRSMAYWSHGLLVLATLACVAASCRRCW